LHGKSLVLPGEFPRSRT